MNRIKVCTCLVHAPPLLRFLCHTWCHPVLITALLLACCVISMATLLSLILTSDSNQAVMYYSCIYFRIIEQILCQRWKLLAFLKYPEKLKSDIEIWHIWKTLIGKWTFKNVSWQNDQQFSCRPVETIFYCVKLNITYMPRLWGMDLSLLLITQILSHSFSGVSQLGVPFFAQQPRTNKNTRLTKAYVHEGKWTWLKSLSEGAKVVSKFLHVFCTTVSLSVQNSFIFNIFEVFLRSGYLELLLCNILMTLTPKLWLNYSLTLLFLVCIFLGGFAVGLRITNLFTNLLPVHFSRTVYMTYS